MRQNVRSSSMKTLGVLNWAALSFIASELKLFIYIRKIVLLLVSTVIWSLFKVEVFQPHLSENLTDFWWSDEISIWSQHVVLHIITLKEEANQPEWQITTVVSFYKSQVVTGLAGSGRICCFSLIRELRAAWNGRHLPSRGWWAPPSCTRPLESDLWLLFWRSGVAAWTVGAFPHLAKSCRRVWSELLAIALSNTNIQKKKKPLFEEQKICSWVRCPGT